MTIDRDLQTTWLPIDSLVPYARNARTHSAQQISQIAASIREFGWTNPILIDDSQGIIAGHGRLAAAKKLGETMVPCIRLSGLTDAQRRAYVLADNKLAELAGWDDELLRLELGDLHELDFPLEVAGFDDAELAKLLNLDEINDEAGDDGGEETGEDDVPEPPKGAVTTGGMIWNCGRHRVMCGDSTNEKHVHRLLAGASIDCILTDPPYCSGGFQEASKGAGSIGTEAIGKGEKWEGGIANDKLSSRGFAALIKSAFGHVSAKYLYCFTDWRMWVHLFDAAESSGFACRSMLVWAKTSAGMGQGWRAQHELCYFGAKVTPKFDPHKSSGNILEAKRTGNKLHPTQKPVELLEKIIDVTGENAETYYDAFSGSGTTLIAAEKLGKTAYLMELEPRFVDVIVKRWQEQTGYAAKLEHTGESFDELAARLIDE